MTGVLAPVSELSDVDIVERVLNGETALYELLMRRYNQRVYRVARSILHDPAEAEDVMQDAYVRAYEHLKEFAGEAKFSTWLTKIAVYEALRRAKQRGRTIAMDPMDTTMTTAASHTSDPEKLSYDEEVRVVLERAIDALPDGYRSVFMLRAVEGLDVAETAATLEIGTEAVKTRLHRARAMLRGELQRRAGIGIERAFPFHLSRCDRVVKGVLARIGGRATK